MTTTIASELDRYGIIKTNFGSVDNFIRFYNQSYNDEYGIYRLIQFPINDVLVINRNKYKFSLIRKINNNLEFDSIDTTIPYSILNYKGEKLYSVADHNGIFGNSELDLRLIENKSPIGLYILEYDSFRKTEYRLIIVDNIESNIKLPQYSASLVNKTSENQYLVTNSLVFFSNSPFTVYTLPKPINNEINLNNLLADPLTVEYPSTTNQTSFVVKESIWLAVIKETEAIPLLQVEGLGADRLIERTNNLYYLVFNTNYTKSYIRRLTGINEFSGDTIQLKIQV